jgi:tripartite-type tricarboxylate transporter receptor subunit TctC
MLRNSHEKEGKMHRKMVVPVLVAVMMVTAGPGWSQDKYPTRPVQLICPYAPGGGSDLSARIVAEKMGELLGQPMVVVNKAGGATALGISSVTSAKPDGYTLLTTSTGVVLINLTTPDLPYKLNDLAPVGTIVRFNYLVMVNKDFPARTLAEMVDYIRKNPNAVNYGTESVGGNTYFLAQMLKMNAKLDMQHIPYPGTNPTVTSLLGNHIQVAILNLASCLSHIRSGAIRPLAILSDKRDSFLPEVPTCVELGYPELAISSFHVMMVPAKTPAPLIKRLESTLEKSLQDRQIQDKITKLNLTPEFNEARFVQNFIDTEYKKWGVVLKKINYKN